MPEALPTTVRAATRRDTEALRRFRCSTGEWYEDEVEQFIQSQMMRQHELRQPHTDHRILLLTLPRLGIVAVGSHEEDFVVHNDETISATRLEVAAVSLDHQGAVLPDEPTDDGRPVTLGLYLMDALKTDAISRERRRGPVFYGVVAQQNTRSLRLCARVGLSVELPAHDSRYVQRLGVLPDA